ncbi:MAG: DUF4900 domain-containing protein [bacterium]|nr:DUF4900 domain-containing protein [bacterium]
MGKAILLVLSGFIILYNGFREDIRNTATDAVEYVSIDFSKKQAKFIAESGVNRALTTLKTSPGWTGQKLNVSVGGGSADINVFGRADISPTTVEVRCTGEFNNVIDSTGVIIDVFPISDRFSRYAYFSNREDNIWFYSADTLYGPVHTNGRFNMTGEPVFHGLISSVSPTYNTMGYTDPQFLGGTDFDRESIDLEPDFTDLVSAAQNGGHLIMDNTLYLNFNNDGTYLYKVGSSGTWQTASIPSNGVIACNRNIYVEGVINGQVTIGTTRNIYITDDLVYADDPGNNPESDDLLGLVAYDNVIIKDNSATRDGITIQGTILARDGSFKAEYIEFYPPARLNLYGGIVQEIRGAVGRLGSPPKGYEKYYEYDKRMEHEYPPFYPIAPGSTMNIIEKAKITIIYWKN